MIDEPLIEALKSENAAQVQEVDMAAFRADLSALAAALEIPASDVLELTK